MVPFWSHVDYKELQEFILFSGMWWWSHIWNFSEKKLHIFLQNTSLLNSIEKIMDKNLLCLLVTFNIFWIFVLENSTLDELVDETVL